MRECLQGHLPKTPKENWQPAGRHDLWQARAGGYHLATHAHLRTFAPSAIVNTASGASSQHDQNQTKISVKKNKATLAGTSFHFNDQN